MSKKKQKSQDLQAALIKAAGEESEDVVESIAKTMDSESLQAALPSLQSTEYYDHVKELLGEN